MDLMLTNKEALARVVKVGAVLDALSMIWWNSGSCKEGTRHIARSQP